MAGIHLEDQVAPKRCGHLEGKAGDPADEMTAKISAAAAARESANFVLIARTDARAVEGLGRAVDRTRRYADAGADVLFVEALETEEEIETLARVPCHSACRATAVLRARPKRLYQPLTP